MLTKTDRNGKIFTYTYDGLGRLLNTKNNAAILEEFTYTLTGNTRTESNGTALTTNTYDSLGRLTKAEDKNLATNVITTKDYTYDVGSNKLSSVIKVGGVTTNNTVYTYDEASRMKTVSEGSTLQSTYNYDVNGNRSSVAYNANGMTTDYTYNLANMLKTLTNKTGSTIHSSYTYTYQLDGNQTSKTDNAGKVTTYVYDGLGRLTSETEQTGSTVTFSLAYTYDASNNRTSMNQNGAVTAYVYDKNNRLTSTTETVGTTVTKADYTYDKNGNNLAKMTGVTANDNGQSVIATLTETSAYVELYEYDLLSRMTYSNAEGVESTYKYRPDGLRFSKTSSGEETVHIWDGANIVGDVANGTVSATYVRGINLIASKSGSTFTYYLYNGHGDVVQLANASGAVTKTYDYDAFGVEKNPVSTNENPFRYCGEYYDKETMTIYLRARYYNPEIGRFTQQDSWAYMKPNDPLSLNLYTYGHNNPVRFHDPSGNTIEDTCKGIVASISKHLAGESIEKFFTWMWGTSVGYVFDSEYDFYKGRMIGDAMSMLGGAGMSAWGVFELVTTVLGGGALTVTGVGAGAGVAISVAGASVATVEIVAGGAIAAAAWNDFNNNFAKMQNAGNNSPKNVYNSIKDSPNYPNGFQSKQNGTTKHNVDQKNKDFLNNYESGKWQKVYKDGYDAYGNKISIHYFESSSGKVFDVKIKSGWSNP